MSNDHKPGLCLTRRIGEEIVIGHQGNTAHLFIDGIRGNQVKCRIVASPHTPVNRGEIWERILAERPHATDCRYHDRTAGIRSHLAEHLEVAEENGWHKIRVSIGDLSAVLDDSIEYHRLARAWAEGDTDYLEQRLGPLGSRRDA